MRPMLSERAQNPARRVERGRRAHAGADQAAQLVACQPGVLEPPTSRGESSLGPGARPVAGPVAARGPRRWTPPEP
jgi:hypothetical protein